MAALVCDICGGKLIMGAGGIAVCDSCGMEHSADRMKEKVQEIRGTVRVDNSHMIENYLELANNAYDSDNNVEAESYCNKIIEIDPTNSDAWLLKGKSCGWQSTLQNPRISESVSAFVKAISNCLDNQKKEEFIQEAKEQVKNLSIAMISLRADRFIKWPDEEETSGYLSDIRTIIDAVISFMSQIGETITAEEIMLPIATKINQSVVQAFQTIIYPEYRNEDYLYPDKNDLAKFIERIGYCTTLVNAAITLCGVNGEESITYYENLISLENHAINACAYDSEYHNYRQDSLPRLTFETHVKNGYIPDVNNNRYWYVVASLTDEAKNTRKQLVQDYENKITAIKNEKAEKEAAERAEKERVEKEEAQKRFDAYWVEHVAEKAALEAEEKSLIDQIKALQKEKENIPGAAEKENIQKQINAFIAEKVSLGLFKGKEKKALQDKIDAANLEMGKITDRMDAAKKEIEKKIVSLQQRIAEINVELTKAR